MSNNVPVEREPGFIVLVPETLRELARRGPEEYLDKRVPPYNEGLAAEGVTKLEIELPDGGPVELAHDKGDDTLVRIVDTTPADELTGYEMYERYLGRDTWPTSHAVASGEQPASGR